MHDQSCLTFPLFYIRFYPSSSGKAGILKNEPCCAFPVKKFYVFYVVIGNVMEVRTLVYNRRDLTKII